MNFRPTYAEINLKYVQSNFNVLKSIVDKKVNSLGKLNSIVVIPMIKANAYGHSDIAIAKALIQIGADHFGVSSVEEGLSLRSNGVLHENILNFGDFDEQGFKVMRDNQIIPVVHSFRQLKILENVQSKISSKEKTKVHLKINTGMNRLGFKESQIDKVVEILLSLNSVDICGVCTHFSGEDDQQQLRIFNKAIGLLLDKDVVDKSCLIHFLSSYSIFSFNLKVENIKWRKIAARPGIALYGGGDFVNTLTGEKLKPVMQLKSKVIATQEVLAGEKVSYGGDWEAKKKGIVAIIPIGYGDGYPRKLSNKGFVLFRGKRVPVVGRVCMDFTIIDVTDLVKLDEDIYGEEVVLFGEQKGERLMVEELAALCDTISYEILSNISLRVPRVFV